MIKISFLSLSNAEYICAKYTSNTLQRPLDNIGNPATLFVIIDLMISFGWFPIILFNAYVTGSLPNLKLIFHQ